MSHNLLNQECEATKAANDGRKGWFQTPCTCPVAEEKHGCTRNHQHYIGCAGPVRIPQPTSDWEEALQIEVMEDYVIDIQDGFAIQQRGTDTEYAESCKKMQGHFEKLKAFIRQVEADARTNEREAAATAKDEALTEDTSDGYHTFKELYEFRRNYNAVLFNEWAAQGKYGVHKSQRHGDGELCFGRDDYFIVMATPPTGQISNHYPMSDWEMFKCEAREKADVWDGHTPQDVAKRLFEITQLKPQKNEARTNLLTALKAVLGEKKPTFYPNDPDLPTAIESGYNSLHDTITRFIKEQEDNK